MRLIRLVVLPLAPVLFSLAGCGGSKASEDSAAPQQSAPVPGVGDGLAVYVGKYPDEEIGGVSWASNRAVVDGVLKAVDDPAVAARVLAYVGPTTPIAMVDGKVVAGQCDAQHCSAQNWEVLVDPQTGATDVCWHDEAKTPGKSVWFLADGKQEQRAGPCAIG